MATIIKCNKRECLNNVNGVCSAKTIMRIKYCEEYITVNGATKKTPSKCQKRSGKYKSVNYRVLK